MNHILQYEREVQELQKLKEFCNNINIQIRYLKWLDVSQQNINFYFGNDSPPAPNVKASIYEVHPRMIEEFNIPFTKTTKSYRLKLGANEGFFNEDFCVDKKTGNIFSDLFGLSANVIYEIYIARRKLEIQRDDKVVSHLYYLPDPEHIDTVIDEKIAQILEETALKLL